MERGAFFDSFAILRNVPFLLHIFNAGFELLIRAGEISEEEDRPSSVPSVNFSARRGERRVMQRAAGARGLYIGFARRLLAIAGFLLDFSSSASLAPRARAHENLRERDERGADSIHIRREVTSHGATGLDGSTRYMVRVGLPICKRMRKNLTEQVGTG